MSRPCLNIDTNDLEIMRKIFHHDKRTGSLFYNSYGKWLLCKDKYKTNETNTWYKRRIGNKTFYVHRIIWFITYGYWPVQVDHINGIKNDNRLSNLRESIGWGNWQNRPPYPREGGRASQYKGLTWNANRWHVRIHVTENGESRRINLGRYRDEKEAALAYNEGAKKYYGEFAWLNVVED